MPSTTASTTITALATVTAILTIATSTKLTVPGIKSSSSSEVNSATPIATSTKLTTNDTRSYSEVTSANDVGTSTKRTVPGQKSSSASEASSVTPISGAIFNDHLSLSEADFTINVTFSDTKTMTGPKATPTLTTTFNIFKTTAISSTAKSATTKTTVGQKSTLTSEKKPEDDSTGKTTSSGNVRHGPSFSAIFAFVIASCVQKFLGYKMR